jgi:hypothetical protein
MRDRKRKQKRVEKVSIEGRKKRRTDIERKEEREKQARIKTRKGVKER